MIRKINDNFKIDNNIVNRLEERLAMELEERQEFMTCNGSYCSGANASW